MNIFILFLNILLLFSCSKGGDNRLAEQEAIKTKTQIEAQNENLRKWAEKMEQDLNERKYFIRAIEGTFVGDLVVDNIDLFIKAELISSIPISFSNRSRTLDEINYELENLAINLNIKLENPRVSNSAVSCTIEGFRPDIDRGILKIMSESCKNIFKLMLSDELEEMDNTILKNKAKSLANSIRTNEIQQIDFLSGVFESSVSTGQYQFKLQRN